MKKLLSGLLVLGSLTAFAQEIKPLAKTSEAINVLGCFGVFKTATTNRETVVFRIFQGLNSFVVNENNVGQVVVLEGETSPNSRGLTGSHMPFESQATLPEYYNEDWSYPAPSSTILAVRGNYKGFFLSDSAEGLLARHKLYQVADQNLECTSDKVLILEKIKSVLKFSPM